MGECDFETNWCGWRDNSSSALNGSKWHRVKHVDVISSQRTGSVQSFIVLSIN